MSTSEHVEGWLAEFASALNGGDRSEVTRLFAEESYWRDLIAFTWNVITLEGKQQIAAMLDQCLANAQPVTLSLSGEPTIEDDVTEAWFELETAFGRGRGLLRLVDGRCWTLLTAMEELKGHEEKKGPNRVQGVAHGATKHRVTWLDERRREEQELGHSQQPYCLIIGGGQGGIMLAARLRRLGVPAIIIEKNDRAGDSWRNRYRSLVLHDPVWYDHLPYLPFPDDWPVFTPKDKMGDWLEAYVSIMELNYWSSTECVSASFDDKSAKWNVSVVRDGEPVTLHPDQLVIATGAYGFAKIIDFDGAEKFRGEVFHTSQYKDGAVYAGKRCAVIGSGSSAHDICADLWENDADVTMIQRSPSIVVRSDTLMKLGFASLYSEEAVARGISVDKADLLFASVPFRLMPQFQAPLYAEMVAADAEFYQKLSASGFLWDMGKDNSGLLMKALRTASGYYIDVGASDLIIDGEITVKSGVEIDRFDEHGIIMADGERIDADVIVHATGYGFMDEMVSRLISPEVANRIGKFWGYGSGIAGDPGPWEGELRNMWKPTRQEALWFHGGNLALSRHYSLVVALQIKARMEGIPTPVYPPEAFS
ncbi:MAG: flavin-containing monooxygenase [Rhizobiaceae bacterium]